MESFVPSLSRFYCLWTFKYTLGVAEPMDWNSRRYLSFVTSLASLVFAVSTVEKFASGVEDLTQRCKYFDIQGWIPLRVISFL